MVGGMPSFINIFNYIKPNIAYHVNANIYRMFLYSKRGMTHKIERGSFKFKRFAFIFLLHTGTNYTGHSDVSYPP